MGEQDHKTDGNEGTEREETVKDLDLSEQESEQVKGGLKREGLPKK